MKRNYFTVISIFFLFCYVFAFTLALNAQRTLVAPLKAENIRPVKTNGDYDFYGNGPSFAANVTVRISPGGGQLLAEIICTWRETKPDNTTGRAEVSRVIYNAPPGKQIVRIVNPTQLYDNINHRFTKQGGARLRGTRNGPVQYLMVQGDGNGGDFGNEADKISCSVQFNAMVVELQDLPADIAEVSISKSLLTNQLRQRLRGTTGRLNTYGPRHNDSWFLDNDAFLSFPNTSGSGDPVIVPISGLSEIVRDARRYNFNDINLSGLNVTSDDQYLRLALNWESEGPEAIGHCVDDAGCGAGTPTLQVNDLVIGVGFRLEAAGGRIQYESNDIPTLITYNGSADCGILTDLCNAIFNGPIKNNLYNAQGRLSNQLRSATTGYLIGDLLTSGFQQYVAGVTGRQASGIYITDCISAGNSYLIRYRR